MKDDKVRRHELIGCGPAEENQSRQMMNGDASEENASLMMAPRDPQWSPVVLRVYL